MAISFDNNGHHQAISQKLIKAGTSFYELA
jgi:hypothetical protein